MGQRQEQDEIIYGDDCPDGFPAGETPKYVYARFSQIVACPGALFIPPNDRVFKLTQHTIDHCLWQYQSGDWSLTFAYFSIDDETVLILQDTTAWKIYFWDLPPNPPDEGHTYHNRHLVCGAHNHAIEGIATVTWRLETLALLNALNIGTAYDLFMEMHPLVDGNRVYKYCKLKDATNIAIEFEPD